MDWEEEQENVEYSTLMVACDLPPMLVEDAMRELERFNDPYPISGDQLALHRRNAERRMREAIRVAAVRQAEASFKLVDR